jgi:hypothetical protein
MVLPRPRQFRPRSDPAIGPGLARPKDPLCLRTRRKNSQIPRAILRLLCRPSLHNVFLMETSRIPSGEVLHRPGLRSHPADLFQSEIYSWIQISTCSQITATPTRQKSQVGRNICRNPNVLRTSSFSADQLFTPSEPN